MEITFDSNSEHVDRTFKQLKMANQTVNGVHFENCKFLKGAFQEAIFLNCKFHECAFEDCNLRMLRVTGSSFRETSFHKSNVSGVNWVEALWAKTVLFEAIGFTSCDISNSTFIGLDLKNLVLTACTATNADFAEANLMRANCTHTDFADCRFLHTNLTEADFTNALNYAIDVTINVVKKAKFSLPEAVNLLRCMSITLVE